MELLEVLDALEGGAGSCDAIAGVLEIDVAEAAGALATLESLGYVSCSLVGVYTRTMLRPPSAI
jgi:DNA-binding IclR family transcriptional regulator